MTASHVRSPVPFEGVGDASPDAIAYRLCLAQATDQITPAQLHAAIRHVRRDSQAVGELMARHGELLRDPQAFAASVVASAGTATSALERIQHSDGPGGQLWRMLGRLGIEHTPDCPCLDWAARMDGWGPAGCRRHVREIAKHLRESAANYGWRDIAAAVARASVQLGWRLNPARPWRSLVHEAIRRAEDAVAQARAAREAEIAAREPRDILIPVGAGSAHDDLELRFALRTIERFAIGWRRVFVVGRIPEWLRETDRIVRVAKGEARGNKAFRIAAKVLWACKHLPLTATFLFWNDDYFLLNPIDVRGIPPHFHGDTSRPDSTGWRAMLDRTGRALRAAGYPSRHYDLHIPMPIERDRFIATREWWEASRQHALTMKSLYGNIHCTDEAQPARDAKVGGEWARRIDRLARHRWVISCNDEAIAAGLASWLEAQHPRPSESERTPPASFPAPPRPQQLIAVVGPYRSGTSAIAGALARLGVPLGEGWAPSRRDNKGGTYEDAELGRLCRAWFREPSFERRSTRRTRRRELAAWLRDRGPIVGAKHPLLCLAVRQLRLVSPAVRFVATDRDPAHSAASLAGRGVRMWSGDRALLATLTLRTARDEALAALDAPVLRVSYDALLRDPAAAVDRLIEFVRPSGVYPTAEQRAAAIEWIRPEWRTVSPADTAPPEPPREAAAATAPPKPAREAAAIAPVATQIRVGPVESPPGTAAPTLPRIWSYWVGPQPPWITLCVRTLRRHVPGIEILDWDTWCDLYTGPRGLLDRLRAQRPNVQSDFVRAWLLHRLGGIWCDADCIALRDLRVTFGAHWTPDNLVTYSAGTGRAVCTALLAFGPRSTIGGAYFHNLRQRLVRSRGRLPRLALGPRQLMRAVRQTHPAPICLLPPDRIHPVHWSRASDLWQPPDAVTIPDDAWCVMLTHRSLGPFSRDSEAYLLNAHTVYGRLFRRALDD